MARKREVWIAKGQDPKALNTALLATLRFEHRLSRGRDYAADSVLAAIRKADNREAAAEAIARAWGGSGPSLSTLGKWRRALDARWPDWGLAILALAAQAAAAAPPKPAAEKKEGA